MYAGYCVRGRSLYAMQCQDGERRPKSDGKRCASTTPYEDTHGAIGRDRHDATVDILEASTIPMSLHFNPYALLSLDEDHARVSIGRTCELDEHC